MSNKNIDITEDGIKFLGRDDDNGKKNSVVTFVIVLIIGVISIILFPHKPQQDSYGGLFEDNYIVVDSESEESTLNQCCKPYTEKVDTVVHNVKLSIFIPHNATPCLHIGAPDESVKQSVLGFQAADLDKDGLDILGMFIQQGRIVSTGTSRNGYCAIVNGRVKLGMSDDIYGNLDKLISQKVFLFRQYMLVDNGMSLQFSLGGKSVKRALCIKDGQAFVVVSNEEVSISAFAISLGFYGVDSAISLVGGDRVNAWYRDDNQELIEMRPAEDRPTYYFENYIIWK